MAEASFIRSRLLAEHAITGLFTLRTGGISPPPFNSQNFAFGLGDTDRNIQHNLRGLVQAAALKSMPHQAMQNHTTATLWCSGQGSIHTDKADILLTSQHDTALAVRVADCLPVLLADPDTGITAAVHAGWRGTAAKVVKHAVEAMLQRGAQAEHILASLGPCIGPCCFSIGQDTALALKNSATAASDYVHHTADLLAINRLQLRECGLSQPHIESIKVCTACDSQRFFSYRRDGPHTGRQLAVVAIPSST